MTEKPIYVNAGAGTRKAWDELSAQERWEWRRVYRYLDPDMIETPVPWVVLVLDGDLPANTVGSIVADPANSDQPMLVFSRGTYSYAASVMADHVRTSKKANALLRHFGCLDITAEATVVGHDRNILLELEMPNQSLWESRDPTELSTVATSSVSVEIPELGCGQLYRFTPQPR